MQEIVSLRTETSKTFDLGGGKRRCVISGAIHYKDNYADKSELWKDIDLTWENNRITKAPYELTLDGGKLSFKDKKTGEVSRLELISVKPSGLKFEIIPHLTGVSFQHILPSDKIPFEAQFKVTGNAPLRTRAFDDEGELGLETSLKDGILTEKLLEVKDRETGRVRAAIGQIRIDPEVLTVQPSAKDNYLTQTAPDTNRGNLTSFRVYDKLDSVLRSILEFDISDLPAGAEITSASLSLYYDSYVTTNPSGKTVWVYKLTRIDWVEGIGATDGSESCWNNYKAGNNWTTPGGDYVTSDPSGGSTTFPASAGAWMTWNVLAIVQDAYDNLNPAEFLVRFATEDLATGYTIAVFLSKEYTTDPSLQPKLVIDYTAPVAKPHTFRLDPRPRHRMRFYPNLKLG